MQVWSRSPQMLVACRSTCTPTLLHSTRRCHVAVDPSGAVASSYSEWAGKNHQCPIGDLTRGVKQAYLSLGALIDASVRVPRKDLEKRLEKYFRREGSLAGASVTEENTDTMMPASSPVSGLDAAKASLSEDSFPIDSIPIGEKMKRHVVVALRASGSGKFNPYMFSHPNDYILDARLQSFQQFEADCVKTVMNIEQETQITRPDGTTEVQTENKVEFVTTVVTTVNKTPKQVDDQNSSDGAPKDSNGEATNNNKAPLDPCDRRVTISATVPATMIPRSAKAYVLFSLLVVCPPRRFYRAYDWFYARFPSYESENERVAFSTVFASSAAFGMMRAFDAVIRLATGHPAEFQSSKTMSNLLHLPENISQCPPCKRKYVGMYLSKDGVWTLAEVSNSSDVFNFCVPTAEQ